MNRIAISLVLISITIAGCVKDYRMTPYQPSGNLTKVKNTETDKARLPINPKPPQYPRVALVEGLCGWVKVGYYIDQNGNSHHVKVLNSSPKGLFDKYAVQAVKSWKWAKQENWNEEFFKTQKTYVIDFKMDVCNNT
jgi:TonB family protein